MTQALRSILSAPEAIRALPDGIYSAVADGSPPAPYDRKARGYDAVVGRSAYHRIFWGCSAAAYTRFARDAIAAAGDGVFAEAGCGSLLFTAGLYAEDLSATVVVTDRSLTMLHRGLRRIERRRGSIPERVTLLHADATKLPVRPAAFSSVLLLNVLHVPCDRAAIVRECARLLVPRGGRRFVSSLVLTTRWSRRYMSLLERSGVLANALTVEQLHHVVASGWGVVESSRIEGQMCFLVVRRGSA